MQWLSQPTLSLPWLKQVHKKRHTAAKHEDSAIASSMEGVKSKGINNLLFIDEGVGGDAEISNGAN